MVGTCLTNAFALIRSGAASGNRTPDLLITRRSYRAHYGVYQRQQWQCSHLRGQQRHRLTGVRTTFDSTEGLPHSKGWMMQAPKHTRAKLYSTTTHEWAWDALLQLSTTLDTPHGVSSAIE
jgi:hypothetical protein